jgi:hypothetical protein
MIVQTMTWPPGPVVRLVTKKTVQTKILKNWQKNWQKTKIFDNYEWLFPNTLPSLGADFATQVPSAGKIDIA